MFAKLAIKNIKRSIKDYAIYFFTLVLGVAIFYIFNSIGSQTIMLDVNDRVRDMLELINVIMGAVSVLVSFILGALIIYASRFLIKRRSKEFGIYLTLGMSKRKISLILLLETFFIGLLSLGVGLLIGILVSQFISVLVANMFEANLTEFQFVFSLSALVKTLIYFGVIYLIVMIFNTINISRQRLITLLSNSRRSEKIKLKNLWVCTLVFIVAAVLLGIAYYLVTAGIGFVDEVSDLLIPIIMGVVATFLLFWSLSGLLLRIFMSFKGVYYKNLNSFILHQFSSKINTTVMSMGMICLMLFVTVCVLGSALSINGTLHESIDKSLPVDVQIESVGRDPISIEEIYDREDININELLKDIVTYRTYILEDFSVKESLADIMDSIGQYGEVQYTLNSSERFMHVSDYNRVASLFGLPALELNQGEYAVLADYNLMVEVRNAALKQGAKINLLGNVLKPKYDECIFGTIELAMSKLNTGLIIVPDSIQLKDTKSYVREYMLANYVNPDNADEVEQQIYSVSHRFFREHPDQEGADEEEMYYYNVTSRQEIVDNNVGTSAMVTFVGLYLGIIFLISSAAVLALKELSESSDNREKYTVLRKIGTSEHTLNKALFWQIFIFFIFPLLIAILHSVFGLMFCDFLLSSLGGISIAHSVPWVVALLLVIYGGYFLITYACSRNIIREHRA